ncbi:Relaxase/mobilization nuclease family protein (plasmid) [Crinalium epipsammum PCC 9333]|uniref:Relaxase/mobilization nuclease family protein n=1 Tax=Crinalium epipsammum PCC 9333 TaxID=1173022 RepID=K9W7L5_9CYAN|nr:relaxase/mobilization nuclease domain-containing protein [Crinalium epipsammum]AFZ15727.1 Relaxase/mobilization nuclease family protein [Crinalium epipsammum PCC 9333]
MIGKQIISNGFGATSKYVLGKEDAELLYSNMGGANYQQLSQEFAAIARLRPNNNRACLHAVLSLPHREDDQGEVIAHESLNNNQWVEIGQRWLEEMGFTDNQYLMVRHHDTKHEHLHIVANRIRLDGEVVPDSYNFFRSQAVIRKIEQDYELEAVTPSWETHRRAPTTPELKEFERTGTGSVRLTIAELAQEAASNSPTMPEYLDRMKELGVEVKVNITRNDKVRGLSYSMGAYAFQGSDIGKDYSWNGLQQYLGVSYVQSRDFETISQGESRTNNSKSRPARTSQQNESGDRTVEPTVSQPAAADHQFDPGKQLVQTAVNQLNRNTEQLTAAVSQLDRSTDDFSRRLEQTNSNSRKRATNLRRDS